jgi:hypothetical protein
MSVRINDYNGLRTEAQAKSDLASSTLKETLMVPVYEQQFGVRIKDNGVANDGSFITDEESKTFGKKMGNPDWHIWGFNGGHWVKEAMVHSQVFEKYSFKEKKLSNMVGRNVPILVLRETYVDEIPVDTLRELSDDVDEIYTESLPGNYGGGPGRVLYTWQIKEFVKAGKIIRTTWSEDALKLIDPTAFAPRRVRV